MMKIRKILLSGCLVVTLCSCGGSQNENLNLTLSKDALFDKVKGAWAGQVIGCTYGGLTEFRYLSTMIPDSIVMPWGPGEIKKWFDGGGGLYDDVYVDLTFIETMERCGLDTPADSFAVDFLAKEYPLCHANQQARYNLLHGLSARESGYWKNNPHANCLDFQIEADFAGIVTPGMVNSAVDICDRAGHIMACGDGWYGGVYVAAMYSLAYVSNDVNFIVTEALKSVPAESKFHECMSDVICWHQQYPTDWKKCWQEIENKWGTADIACPDGVEVPFNIEAYVNGAYIVLGLLYGEGDFERTIDISTRAGQDSDCNPSSALGVLGVINGFEYLSQSYKDVLVTLQDTLFRHTDYTLKKAIDRTYYYIEQHVKELGGQVANDYVSFIPQEPKALPFEDAFPDILFDKHISIDEKGYWETKGDWAKVDNALYSNQNGNEISFTFEGSGVSLQGWWVKDGGKADVYVDGAFKRTIDCYYNYGNHEHKDANIYHILGLPQGKHVVKLVVKAENRPEASDCKIGLIGAVIFKTGKKNAL